MSAIVAAMVALRDEHARTRNPEDALLLAWDLGDACTALVAASNAACSAMVDEGAPRTWAVRWSPPLWPSGRGWIARDSQWQILAEAISPHAGLRPCWNAANRLWVWGTAAHDPRPCAWPRPFARGADR